MDSISPATATSVDAMNQVLVAAVQAQIGQQEKMLQVAVKLMALGLEYGKGGTIDEFA